MFNNILDIFSAFYFYFFFILLWQTDSQCCFLAIIQFQEVANHLAKMSVEACGKLAGFYVSSDEQSTPDNPSVKKSLYALLTPYLAKKLSNESPVEVGLLDLVLYF